MARARTILMAAALATVVAGEARASDAAQAIAQKFSEADQPKPAERPKAAARPSLDYEMDMLRRARAEKLERQQQETANFTKAAPTEATEAAPSVTAANNDVKVTPPEKRAPLPTSEGQQQPPQPRVAEAPAATKSAVPTEPSPAPSVTTAKATEDVQQPPSPMPAAVPATSLPGGPRVTFLLSLATDAVDLPHPDPILCMSDTCWLSNGLEDGAKPVQRSVALALKSTATASEDSCAGKSACVYRNVAVPDDAVIEVIEIGAPQASRNGGFSIAADKTCRIEEGDLVCDSGLETRDYRMWAVPETTATSVGAAALEAAIDDDLEGGDVQSSNDK